MKVNGNKTIAVSSENVIFTWEQEQGRWIERFYLRDPETRKFYCQSETRFLSTEDVESFCEKLEAKGFAIAR